MPGTNIVDVLRLDEVSCSRRGRKVIDRLSLTVESGQLVVIEGSRGAGKTTLLAIAATAIRPDAGTVAVAGRDVLALQRSSLPFVRRNIGYLPPDPPLVRHESALENVLLALAVRGFPIAEAETRARAALDRVGVAEAVNERVSALSMGERRLVALARALVGGQVLVLLDEPVAGLAPGDREMVAAAIGAARAAGAAVLCATADENFAVLLARQGGERLTLAGGRFVGGAPRIRLLATDQTADPEGAVVHMVEGETSGAALELDEDDLVSDGEAGSS